MGYVEEKINEINKEAETMKESLLITKHMEPPMSQRKTMSVSALLKHCNTTLFLCSVVVKLMDENRQLKLDMERIKKLAKNGQNS